MCLGTPLYMAPELVNQEKYSEKVDVWSLGCIVYQLLSGQTPFEANDLEGLNNKILNKKVSFNQIEWINVSKKAKNFIKACLDKNQNTRPNIKELLDHPWMGFVDERDQASEK